MSYKGTLITFEGGEGCGKSTHSKELKKYLEMMGLDVVLTMEPGSTALGRKIRSLLLSPSTSLDTYTELMLFAADRIEHVEQVILPALKKGKVVVCDRFTDSTLAYQIAGRGLPEDVVRYVNFISSKGIVPDLTVILDVDPEVGIKRAGGVSGKRDRFEKQDLRFHKRVRDAYLKIAKGNPERAYVIDSLRKKEEVWEDLIALVRNKLSLKG
jgi:dTMP kinase